MNSKTLIQAVEIWRPDPDGYLLEFADGCYRDAVEFDAISRELVFGRGEGLPGRVWEEGTAVVLDTLQGSNFRRSKAAKKAGLDAAIGLPFRVDDAVVAVVVFFFASPPPAAIASMLGDLGTRVDANDIEGSSPPLASRIEWWALDASGQRLARVHGLADGIALPAGELAEDATIDQGLVAEVFSTGVPGLRNGHADDAAADCTVALPTHRDGTVAEVVTMSL